MKYEEMKIENLRPCMILANFITDEMPKYSYEDYLRDFVNQSPHFLKKSEGKLYQKPKSEANGECDCVSNTYSFDFKLLVSQNRLQADRIFTAEISLIAYYAIGAVPVLSLSSKLGIESGDGSSSNPYKLSA